MEKELSSLYGQFSSKNNVGYSKESVEDIANKFENYSYDKVKTTVNISGADFTYKDLASANKVLSMAVPSNYGVTVTSSDGNEVCKDKNEGLTVKNIYERICKRNLGGENYV